MKNFDTINELIKHIHSGVITESSSEFHLNGILVKDYTLVEDEETGAVSLTMTVEGENRPIIGNIIQIDLPELNCYGLEAKVDTGAAMCCLHADNIDFQEEVGSVTFTIEGKRITMNCDSTVEIQTADNGIDERPVVKLSVVHDDETIPGVHFNLNDRSEMPSAILLGKDFLQAGEFLVDPTKGDTEDVK